MMSGRLIVTIACIALASLFMILQPGQYGGPAVALADDDDGGASAGSGGGNESARSDADRNKKTSRIKSRAKPRSIARAKPRPMLVVLDLPETAQAEIRRRGFTVVSDETLTAVGLRVQRFRIPRRMSTAQARGIMIGLGATASDVNSVYRPQAAESCEALGCSDLNVVNWPADLGRSCAASPVIGLIETSVDTRHVALSRQKIEVIDMRPPGTRKSGANHGTEIAALLVGATAGRGQGLLPDASVIAAVPYYRSSRGHDQAEAYDIVRAIDALAARKPHVINMSLAGPANTVVERAVTQAVALGIPVVAAAGNAGAGARPLYPAAYEAAVAVTAVSRSLKIYRRAPRGAHIDFAAPGVDVRVASVNGRYALRSGTSYAAPFVAGALAVLRKRDPARSVAGLVSDLTASARDLGEPGRDRVFGDGLIQGDRLCPVN